MRTFTPIWSLFVALGLVACTSGPGEPIREGAASIVGKDAHVDDTHAAVVAIVGGGHQCSGTIIGRNAAGDGLYVLSAAHCCQKSSPPANIRVGADETAPVRTLPIDKFEQHPCYNGLSHDYDVCVLQVKDEGTLNVRPIPVATPPDHLAVGSTVTFVGFGSTPAANVARRRAVATISELSPLTLAVDQTGGRGGICFGDSGGPALIRQLGVEVVAGVTSFAASTSLCDVIGAAGRLEHPGIRAEFLDKVLAGEAPTVRDTLILRTGVTPGQVRDTYLASDAPDQSFGDSVTLLAGSPPGTTAARLALLRFDLTGVPAGATILTARAGLHQESRTGEGLITVHRVTKDWDEDRETWASFGEGGFDRTPLATIDNAGAVVKSQEEIWFDLTKLTQEWLAGRAENYGLMLRQGREQTQLMSSEIGRFTERPWMHVCYVPRRARVD